MFTVNFEGTEVFMKPIEIERIVIPEFKILELLPAERSPT
jgi:hypothetical protein